MKRLIIGIVVGLVMGSIITVIAASKKEQSSTDAASVVVYGYNGTALKILKTDATGILQIK
jgi:gas vesicle protein